MLWFRMLQTHPLDVCNILNLVGSPYAVNLEQDGPHPDILILMQRSGYFDLTPAAKMKILSQVADHNPCTIEILKGTSDTKFHFVVS